LNLAVTERSVRLLFADSVEPVSAFGAQLVFMLRFLLVVAAIFLAVGRLGAQPVPFMVGLLLIVPAALWHGLSRAREA
jgi:hypothetical protein